MASQFVQSDVDMILGIGTPVVVAAAVVTSDIPVFIPEPEAAPAVAAEMVNREGASLIELEGGLGPIWTARVLEAVGGSVPVGAVMFGAESHEGAAAFGARYDST